MRQTGRKRFIAAMRTILSGTLSGDFNPRAPHSELRLLEHLAGKALDRGLWQLAYVGRHLAGMVLAQRRPSRPNEGTLFFLGISPAFRGRSYGKILHAKGLELLAHAGCLRYLGGTDIRNKPMLQTFRANGCRAAGTWACDAQTGKRLRRARNRHFQIIHACH